MSAADLREKAADEREQAPRWKGSDGYEQSSLLRAALYECTAALIDHLPGERERAELAALGRLANAANEEYVTASAIGVRLIADALLAARREG